MFDSFETGVGEVGGALTACRIEVHTQGKSWTTEVHSQAIKQVKTAQSSDVHKRIFV